MVRLLLLGSALVSAQAAHAVNVSWVDWQSQSTDQAGQVTVTGQLTLSGQTIDVTYTNPNGIAFLQSGSGTNYFDTRARQGAYDVATSPYRSAGPNGIDNAPTASEMIALRYAGQQTLSFSAPVEGLYFSYVSLNGNGYGFDRDFQILSSGNMNLDGAGTDQCGYWGCGTSTKQVIAGPTPEYRLTGTGEPHGTIFMDGSVSSVTWNSLNEENWNGFTIGVAELSTVPLPASIVGLGLGVAGLGALRRFRRPA